MLFDRVRLSLLLGMVVLAAPALWGQSTGRLSGTVQDPSGAAVPEAIVSLYRPGMTDPANQTRTTSAGLFEFDSLSPESYRVTIEKSGFALYEAKDVRVSPGVQTELNGITLPLGQQPTVVNANENQPSVQIASAEVSATITKEQLDELPLLNRNPLNLIRTQAGVANYPFTTIDGLRTSYSNVSLDGINVQDNTVRYNGLDFVPNNLTIGEVRQFTLVTSNQGALYGNGATQAAFVSPSGTNELHGDVFYLNSNNVMNAGNWLENHIGLNSAIKSNQGGFTIGGPLVHNKLFGYAQYELFRQRNSIGQELLTLDRQNVDFVHALQAVGTVNPAIASILAAFPQANLPNAVYAFQERRTADLDNASARLDYIPSQRNTFAVSYLWSRVNVDEGWVYSPNAAYLQRGRAGLFSASWRFNPTAQLTNEVRFGANINPIAFETPYQPSSYIEFAGPSSNLNPYLNPNQYNQGRRLHTYDIQDNASYIIGRHNLQFGVQMQLIRIPEYLDNGAVPVVAVGNINVNTFEAYYESILRGYAASASQTFHPSFGVGGLVAAPYTSDLGLDNYAPYFQDNWRITPRLSLTVGVRYEHFTPVTDSKDSLFVPNLVNENVLQTVEYPNWLYKQTGSGLYNSRFNTLAPSIGIAWDPFGKGRTAFRGAYGISYVNDDILEAVRYPLSINAQNLGFQFQSFNNVFLPNVPALTPPTLAPAIPKGDELFLIDPNLRSPYVQQWNLGIQQEFAGFLIDARYVGNHAVRMVRLQELQPGNKGFYEPVFGQPANGSPVVLSNSGFYNPNVNTVNTAFYLSNSSSSAYNAFQIDVTRRLTTNFQFQANYTFAKSLTDSGNFTSLAGTLPVNGVLSYTDPYRNPLNTGLDRGPSLFDVRNAFRANVIYELPFGKHSTNHFVSTAIKGWTLSTIVIAQSGTPFSIDYLQALCSGCAGTDTPISLLSGSALNKVISFQQTGNGPNIIAGSARNLDQSSPYFGTGIGNFPGQAFFVPTSGPGTIQPRMFRNPWISDWDVAVRKRFNFTERQNLELSVVAVNVLNHPWFIFANQYINSSSFGTNLATTSLPRTIQLSAYYRF
ncbi:MAG TPA: TonB-dependent receptor [Bryobacteraceae bacterium]|nr:TonB-dependent receptor [Bryobacteraceae bacterium]